MVAPCCGGGGKRKRAPLAIGSATIVLLLFLYHTFYASFEDLSDVFYPPPTSKERSKLPNGDFIDGSASNTDGINPPNAAADPRRWISVPPLPVLRPDSTIFLLETSGRTDISPRKWCAVESAARVHPQYIVLLLTASTKIRRSSLATAVMSLNNTRMAHLQFAELFKDTPLEEWYNSRVVLRSWWQASHMSDALRFALLVRYGGIYLDTDVIVRRSMADMDDGAGLESEHSIAAGVLKFSHQSVMPRLLAHWFVNHYDPGDWGANGPGVVTAVLLQSCGLGKLPLPASHCGEYTIFGSRRFYGIPWPDWRLLLEPSQRDAVLERVDASYVVHTWGLHITGHPAPPGSAMYQLAEQHCPWALRHAGEQF